MADNTNTPENADKNGKISLRGAVFIGIGSMVGAGIFALFGEAGTVAGAAASLPCCRAIHAPSWALATRRQAGTSTGWCADLARVCSPAVWSYWFIFPS
jgi:hypothetical protein